MHEREEHFSYRESAGDEATSGGATSGGATSGGATSGASSAYKFVRVIPVDRQQLRRIKINNISGRTRVIGTNTAQIMVRATAQEGPIFSPNIEVKQEGGEIEISMLPGGNRQFMFNFNRGDLRNFDPDSAFERPTGEVDFDAGDERPDWDNFDEPRDREERRRQRDERRRQRHETREYTRRVREQTREASRQGRSFWNNFDMNAINELVAGIGNTLNEVLSGAGDMYIEVPNWIELEVKSVSGAVEIYDMNSFCQVRNTSGQIRLYRLHKGVQIKGMSGQVEGQELSGRVSAKVVSGNCRLSNCRLTELELSVTNGNILVETALTEPNEGDYKINTTNGQVRLRLPRDSRASIDCRSLSGRIFTAPEIGPVEFRNRPGQSQSRIDLNGGGRKVSINTMSGNIEISLDNSAWGQQPPFPVETPSWPAPPPMPPTPGWDIPVPPGPGFGPADRQAESGPLVTPPPVVQPTISQEVQPASTESERQSEAAIQAESKPEADKKTRQLEILRAIEQGELSVEEGILRLGELDEG